MPTVKKEETVEELKKLLGDNPTTLLTEYRGLTVKEMSELRRNLRPNGIQFQVIKNTLLRRAAEGSALQPLTDELTGPTAVAFANSDPVAATKALVDYAAKNKTFIVKAGVVDGQIFDAAKLVQLSKMPSREILLSQVVGALQSPIVNAVSTMQSIYGQLIWAVEALAAQKSA